MEQLWTQTFIFTLFPIDYPKRSEIDTHNHNYQLNEQFHKTNICAKNHPLSKKKPSEHLSLIT